MRPPPRAADPPRFVIVVEESEPISCREVRGFHEAAAAAQDSRTAPPARLVLIGLDAAARAWVSAWAEDSERVRRTMTLRRLLDDLELTTVATLATYGYGVDTALAVESVTLAAVPSLLRSGAHPKALIEAALGPALGAADPDDGAAGWFLQP